jgi:hypothetical protein
MSELNEAQQRAINNAIAAAVDNLRRAELTMQRNPNWVSGNGEPILELIHAYEREFRQLKGQP